MNGEISVQARLLCAQWLDERLPREASGRLRDCVSQVRRGSKRALFVAFGALPRLVGKADLGLACGEIDAARTLLPAWRPETWSVDQAARTLLVLEFPHDDEHAHVEALRALLACADVREQAALLRCLPLLPCPEHYRSFAESGVRSNVTAVFEAIAFDNAYPCAHFDDHEWNRMVLKAVFQDLGVGRIWGLDGRCNAELRRMAADLARERASARRPPPKEVERIVAAAPAGPEQAARDVSGNAFG